MKLVVKRNRELAPINSQNTQNENKAEIIELIVPEEFESFNKKIVFITPNETVWDVIVNNQYKITNAITQYDKVDYYIWLTKEVDGESIDFRTKTKTLNFYHNEDASDEITDEEIHGVNTVVNLLEEEIEKVENLNIEATKIGSTTTVTITKKDGTTESVEINDGVDGQDGYTPQKGIDYFTEQDIEEIETDVKNDIEENVLVNYSLIAETGAKIELSINTTDYKLKAILKDKNNNIIHTSNVIDLPLETMVVNATYDNLNKAIILTLQNGTTVSISVADLVSGLVSESQLQTILSNYYTKIEINNLLNNKVDKVQGKELSSNDFTDTLKEKLEGLENYDDTEIKADISDIQDEQTEQNTEIEKLQTENARLKATLSTTTGEGQDITLDKTAEFEFIKPPLPMGNSEQETNLYNGIIEQGSLINGEPPSSIATNRIRTKDYIEVVPNTTLPISFLGATDYVAVFYTNDKRYKNQTDWANSGADCEISNDVYYMKLIFKKSDGLAITPSELTNLQIGNIPNPDYPQEITNVTGDVEVKVQNKNLLDGSKEVNTNFTNSVATALNHFIQTGEYATGYCNNSNQISAYAGVYETCFVPISENTNYHISSQASENNGFSSINILDKNGNLLQSSNNWVGAGYAFTTPSNAKYLMFGTRIINIDYIQLIKGTTSIPLVPHKEQVFTFPLGNEKLMLGDYLADDGIHHMRGEGVLDGTETWVLSSYSDDTYLCAFSGKFDGYIKYDSRSLLCNTFVKGFYTDVNTKECIENSGNTVNLKILKSRLNEGTLNGLKTWLAERYSNNMPVIVEYPLAQEVIVPYTSAQQEVYNQIKQVLSYEEQTNISSNTIALFNVEAYQSTKLVLEERDAKYESLEARVALLE